MEKKRFHVINFGCRATQADGAALEQAFLDRHLIKSSQWGASDVVVINTCTVTQAADTQARQMIRRVHRENPAARIVVTGCYAQRAAAEVSRLDGVTCVVGNSHKDQLVPLVLQHHLTNPAFPILHRAEVLPSCEKGDWMSEPASSTAAVYCGSIFESKELRTIADISGGGRTRPVLKVQDGCSYRCSYCVIPYVRGDSRSLAEEKVLRQVECLLDQGFKEVVLTGIHLGGYGRDLENNSTLAGLIRKVLRQGRLERLRLSSVEPLEMTDEIIDLIATSPKMARHFHVPLQSGSDRVLRLMRRPYFTRDYARLVEKMRKTVPDSAIGADVMVGFPTETEADHRTTMELLEGLPVTYLHVFPYSERPGTASARLRPLVPPRTAQVRSLALRELAARKNRQFRSSFVSCNLSVVTLDKDGEGKGVEAISSNYLKVEIPDPGLRPNQFLEVKIVGVTENGLEGTVISGSR
jgi:threonylcarbamoyladenosine tRNA methylthiotransferase MtaB